MSLKEKIFGFADVPKERVVIPEWGGVELEIRGLTAKQRAILLSEVRDPSGGLRADRLYTDLIIASCYDPATGEPVFSYEDRERLGEKNGAIMERLALVALRLSGLEPGAVESAAKNS